MDEMSKIFNHSKFGVLEVILIDGKEYFPATDCAKMLGYSNPEKAIRDHCKTPGCTIRSVGVETGIKADGTPAFQTVKKKYITEGNLYRLITHSKLPAAEKFESWVFDEVIPDIRRTGMYAHGGAGGGNYSSEELAKIVSVTVAETLRQLMPILRGTDPAEPEPETAAPPCIKRIRRQASKIEKLPNEIRDRVDEMLLDRFTFRQIQTYLNVCGISISQSSVHRYARHFFDGTVI